MMLRDLHYAWPGAANLSFVAVGLVFLFWLAYRLRQRQLHSYLFLFVPRSRLFYLLQSLCFVLAWLAAMVALMQPLANGHYPEGRPPPSEEQKLRRPAHEVVLLVDTSASMTVADMHNGQTRLRYVKQLADEMISDLNGEQISLYAFTSGLAPLSPPTLDYLFVRLMLDQVQVNEDGLTGTDYYSVLIELRKRLLQTPASILKTVVIFTDGGDTSLAFAQPGEKSKLSAALMGVIEELVKLNARVYTVGMGTLHGGKVPDIAYQGQPVIERLNESLLKQMAATGHGKYFDANDYTVIEAAKTLAAEINDLSTGAQGQDINNTVVVGEENLIYDHYFQIPLAVAILALLLALYIPDSRAIAKILPIFLMLTFPLFGDDVRPAEILSEAYEYPKAASIIDTLKEGKLLPWQQDVLTYDQGTIFLSQGEWDQALTAFNSIPATKVLPPPLQAQLMINEGIAYLEKAKSLQRLEVPPYAVILNMQNAAIRSFRQAHKSTMANSDSSLLEKIASVQHAITIQKSTTYSLEQSPLQEGMPILLLSLTHFTSDLDFVQSEAVDDNFKEQYLQLYLERQKLWDPLWESQRRNWIYSPLEESQRKEGAALFDQAEEHYRAAQNAMQKHLWGESREAIKRTITSLTGAMRLLYGENPLQDVLQQLLSRYKRTLGQELLTANALDVLKQEQEQLMKVASSDAMTQSLDDVKKAIEGFTQGQQLSPRLYLEIGQEKIRGALAAMQKPSPKQVLEELIAEENFVGSLLLTIAKMENEKVPSGAPWALSQKQLLELTKKFLPLVRKQQTVGYQGNGEHRCQARPWDEVLPLFEKGRSEARQAEALMGSNELHPALRHVARALIFWQQALAALNKPVTDHGSPCQSGGGGKPDESKEKTEGKDSSPPTQPKQGTNDILRVLQELNEDDQLPKTDQGIKKQGLRPW